MYVFQLLYNRGFMERILCKIDIFFTKYTGIRKNFFDRLHKFWGKNDTALVTLKELLQIIEKNDAKNSELCYNKVGREVWFEIGRSFGRNLSF